MRKSITHLAIDKILALFILLGVFILPQFKVHAQPVVQDLWVTNGIVNAIARSGNTIYIGGSFSHVGPAIAYGAPVHKFSGKPDQDFVMPNGDVYVTIPDGKGGWFIGGTFSAVGGQQRKMLARINADGSLHPWNPGVEGFGVEAMIIAYGRLYIAGSFGLVAGQSRTNLASFNLTTGNLTSWNPDASGPYVNSIAIKGNSLYAAGWFNTLGGVPRPGGLGAVEVTTGQATAWNPVTDNASDFRTLAIYGNSLFVGGQFSSLGGQSRQNLAALNTETAQVTSWNPGVIGEVNLLVIDHHTMYVGGKFTSVSGRSRRNLASFGLKNMKLDYWNPFVNDQVSSIASNHGKLYIGGSFTSVNGLPRKHVAAFYTESGRLTPWRVPVNGAVSAISFNNTLVYIGGGFTSIGGDERKNIAAIDVNTGCLLPWNPGADDIIYSLLVSHKKLFVGGSFKTIGHQSRSRLASFNLWTGKLTSFNPNVTGGNYGDDSDGDVTRMVTDGNTIYFTGIFSKVGGVSRRSLAAVDAITGALRSFYPITEETEINDLALANGKLYTGGAFTQMSGQPRTGLASFNLATGQLTPWSPVVDVDPFGFSRVEALAINNNTVYIGGMFNTLNGQPRQGLAAVDGVTGALTDWNPGEPVYGGVYEIATDGANVYVGATFISMAGLLAFDHETGELTDFSPEVSNANGTGDDGFVFAILPAGNRLYIGGDFTSVYDRPRPFFAGFDIQEAFARTVASSTRKPEIENNFSLNAYPTPADKFIMLEIKSGSENISDITLLSQNGQQVWRHAALPKVKGSSHVQIPVENLVNGYYVLRVTFGKTVVAKGVIIQH